MTQDFATAMCLSVHPLPRQADAPGESRSVLRWPGGEQELVFRASVEDVSAAADPHFAASLLVAMSMRQPLAIDRAVSPRLLEASDRIQNLVRGFEGEQDYIEVLAEHGAPIVAAGERGVGCMFSGGVDSFYSVLSHLDEVTHLIFVHGFDVPLSNGPLRETVSRMLRSAAAELGKPLIEVETNVRAFSDRFADWGSLYHGSALASVALLLSPVIGKCYIPSTQFYCEPQGWGSTPAVDPLWSTEAVEIVHDAQVDRSQKVAEIARNETVLKHLRVCYENRGGAFNCGICGKCLRTMVALSAVGALDRCATFERRLDLFSVARVPLLHDYDRLYVEDNLRLLRSRGGNPALERALEDCLRERYYRGIWRAARRIWWGLKPVIAGT